MLGWGLWTPGMGAAADAGVVWVAVLGGCGGGLQGSPSPHPPKTWTSGYHTSPQMLLSISGGFAAGRGVSRSGPSPARRGYGTRGRLARSPVAFLAQITGEAGSGLRAPPGICCKGSAASRQCHHHPHPYPPLLHLLHCHPPLPPRRRGTAGPNVGPSPFQGLQGSLFFWGGGVGFTTSFPPPPPPSFSL